MSQLPHGWAETPIVELLAPLSDGRIIHQGWSPQCAQGASPNGDVWGVLKTTSIQNGRFLPEHNKLLPDALEPRNLLEVHDGDILLTCAGPRIRCGVPCLVRSTRPKLIISGKMYRMRAMQPYVESRFVEAMLRAPITQNAIDGIKTGMSESGMNLTHARFAKLEIPVPPTNEQKRIADKLDAVLARVDACRDRLDRIPTILKRFRQSVLAAATSGKLTEDWRAEQLAGMEPQAESRNIARDSAQPHYAITAVTASPNSASVNLCYKVSDPPDQVGSLPDDWQWVAVGDLATKVADGVHKKPNYVAAGVPFLTVRNMTAGPGLDFSSTSFVTQADHEEFCKRTHPERGDILLSKDGTLGVVRLVDTDRIFSIFVSVALIKLRDKRMSRYMRIAMESPVLQKQMVGVGTGLQHIHLRDLRQDVVPVPPLDEQTEIVRRVEALFVYADRLEARYNAARAQVEKLTPATLAKAFRGELVPQDPKDEPASELLVRIKAQRSDQAVNKPKRSRKVTA